MTECGDVFQRRHQGGSIETLVLLSPVELSPRVYGGAHYDWEAVRINQAGALHTWAPANVRELDLASDGWQKLVQG